MRLLQDASWTRRGFTLLWGANELASVAAPAQVLSIRELFALGTRWPEDLPTGSDALVAAGLEACLDALAPDYVEPWLDQQVRPRLLSFQETYQGSAALILWLPAGRTRIKMSPGDESYTWRGITPGQEELPLGRILFSGAEADLMRLMKVAGPHHDADGDAWVGLHLPRIS